MSVKSSQLAKLGEFGLIKNIQKQCRNIHSNVLLGIGDDAAAVTAQKNNTLITSDMMIEDIHFDLSFTTFYQLGYKFLAVNISDIFAMGGKPDHFIVSLGIPKTVTASNIKELYSGILKIAKKHRVSIIGGDTCASKQGLVLSGTLFGNTRHIVTRSGARVGDSIYITKTLGDSAMGLHLLNNRRKRVHKFTPSSPGLKLIKNHLMPEPAPLKNISGISSMIDISDGLLKDLSHICDKSKAGAVIYKEKIPLSKELNVTAKKIAADPLHFALKGGEDYALLFTAPASTKLKAIKIGEIIKRGRYIIDHNGKKTTFKPEGYEHFR
jgi:thiamine-monophosphate kinase